MGFKIFSCLVLGAIISNNAQAFTSSANFNVKAQVLSSCTIAAADMDFGTFSGAAVGSATSIIKSNITVNCNTGATYRIGLNQGQGTSATTSARKMTNLISNTNTIAYNLYSDAAYSKNWGNTANVDDVAGVGTGAAQTIPVYGNIPANNTVVATGQYQDTITATITFGL